MVFRVCPAHQGGEHPGSNRVPAGRGRVSLTQLPGPWVTHRLRGVSLSPGSSPHPPRGPGIAGLPGCLQLSPLFPVCFASGATSGLAGMVPGPGPAQPPCGHWGSEYGFSFCWMFLERMASYPPKERSLLLQLGH